jgi:hypothetical protein
VLLNIPYIANPGCSTTGSSLSFYNTYNGHPVPQSICTDPSSCPSAAAAAGPEGVGAGAAANGGPFLLTADLARLGGSPWPMFARAAPVAVVPTTPVPAGAPPSMPLAVVPLAADGAGAAAGLVFAGALADPAAPAEPTARSEDALAGASRCCV